MSDAKEQLAKVKLYAEAFRQSLVTRVDPAQVSLIVKVPYKALEIREALLYRATDLLEGACNLIEQDNLVSGAILARAFHETLAVLFYVNRKCKKAINDKDIDHLDNEIMKVLMGSKNNPDMPDPVHILKAIDHTDKEITKFRDVYDSLSEIAHPNWAGTLGVYSQHDKDNVWSDLGRNIKLDKSTRNQSVIALDVGSELLSYIYDEFADFLPELITVCENEINNNKRA